jgi:hypothetical protein
MSAIILPQEKNHIILETSDQQQECNMEKKISHLELKERTVGIVKNCVGCVCENPNCMECSDKNCNFFS